MNKPYNPIAGSIAFKVIEYFTTNPDEVLTIDDLEAKFDKPKAQFHSFLGTAVEAGALKRESNDEGELEYSLGTGVASIKPNAGRNPTAKAKPYDAAAPFGTQLKPVNKQTRRDSATPAIQMDFDGIQLIDNAPMPGKRDGTATQKEKWFALLNRMNIGQSFTIDKALQKTVNSYITKIHKINNVRYSVRKLSDTQIGVWRVE